MIAPSLIGQLPDGRSVVGRGNEDVVDVFRSGDLSQLADRARNVYAIRVRLIIQEPAYHQSPMGICRYRLRQLPSAGIGPDNQHIAHLACVHAVRSRVSIPCTPCGKGTEVHHSHAQDC